MADATPETATMTAEAKASPQSIRQHIEASRIPRGGVFGALLYPFRLVKVIYAWVLSLAGTRWGPVALACLGLINGSLIPIPSDPLLLALCFGNRRRSFHYAALLVCCSVIGGVLGWLVGRHLFESLALWLIQTLGWGHSWFGSAPADMTAAEIARLPSAHGIVFYPNGYFYMLRERFNENAMLVFVTSGFTPIPYNVAVTSGGLFNVPIGTLIIGAAIGRSLRFFGVAALAFFFGPRVKPYLERYFEWITLAVLVVLVAAVVVLRYALKA